MGDIQQRNPGDKLGNTVNLLGRDVLGKLGFTLSQNKGININDIQPDNAIQIRIIKDSPSYAPVWANLMTILQSLH